MRNIDVKSHVVGLLALSLEIALFKEYGYTSCVKDRDLSNDVLNIYRVKGVMYRTVYIFVSKEYIDLNEPFSCLISGLPKRISAHG